MRPAVGAPWICTHSHVSLKPGTPWTSHGKRPERVRPHVPSVIAGLDPAIHRLEHLREDGPGSSPGVTPTRVPCPFRTLETPLPVMSGKRAFLDLLKQEGVEIVFGNPGTTELPLMDAFAVENDIRYVLGLQEAALMAMADGYAQASGKLTVINLHVAPGLGNAMGMLYDAQKAGSPILVTAGQQDLEYLVTEPILSADLPTLARPFVKWAAQVDAPRRPAAPGAPRGQDRAGAADRAGVPVAARRHPEERSRSRPADADPRRAAPARRRRRGRRRRRSAGQGGAPGDHGRRRGGAEPRACRAGRAGRADRRAGLCRVRAEHGVVPVLASAVPRRDGRAWRRTCAKMLDQYDLLFSVGGDLFTLSLPSTDRPDAARPAAHPSRHRPLGDRQELSGAGRHLRRSQGDAARHHRGGARAHDGGAQRAAARERLQAASDAIAWPSARRCKAKARALAGKTPVQPLALLEAIGAMLPKDAVVIEEVLSSAPGIRSLINSDDPQSFFGAARRRHRLGPAGGDRRQARAARPAGGGAHRRRQRACTPCRRCGPPRTTAFR